MTDPEPGRPADVTAVVVNTNDGPKLGELLELIEEEVGAIVVVDNASTDGSLATAVDRPGVTVVRNDANRGFAAAANQGAALAEGEWVLFANPDAHPRPGDIGLLLDGVPHDVAAVAPLQVDRRGRPLAETGGYDPSLGRYLVWAVVPWRFQGRRGPWLAPPFPETDAELDWVSGALLGVRRRAFEELGGFDERFFLYHEDVDFGRRAREAGYRVWCRPAVRLHHEVSHGDPERRVRQGLRGIRSLALRFSGWRRRALGIELAIGYGLRALLGSGAQRALGRAALPSCLALITGRLPSDPQ
ncbi:MAG: glycosyltransferase [Actinomycetota bacterium]